MCVIVNYSWKVHTSQSNYRFLFVFTLFNFQGPCRRSWTFALSRRLIYLITLSSVCQEVFQTFFKVFFGCLFRRSQNALFLLSAHQWTSFPQAGFQSSPFLPKSAVHAGFQFFSALSCDSFVIIPPFSSFVNTFFQSFFYFYTLYIFNLIFRAHAPIIITFCIIFHPDHLYFIFSLSQNILYVYFTNSITFHKHIPFFKFTFSIIYNL